MVANQHLSPQMGHARTGPHKPRILSLSFSFGLLAVFWLLFIGAGEALDRLSWRFWQWPWGAQVLGAVVVAGIGALISNARNTLHRLLTSPHFAVALLSVLLLSTALGTVILQGAPVAQFRARYGTLFSALFLGLGVNDLFHTLWFNGFLLLLCVCLVMVIVKRRFWRMSQWGFFLTHIGTVMILTGGLIGNLFGFKGTIDLHEGQMTKTAKVVNKKEKTVSRIPLGFGLRLDDFEVVNYQPEYRFYVYAKKGNSYQIKKSLKANEISEFTSTGIRNCDFRVTRIIPGTPEGARKAASGKGPLEALEVQFTNRGDKQTIELHAGGALDAVRLPGRGAVLSYVWEQPDEKFLAARRPGPPSHLLVFKKEASSEAEEISVLPGGTYSASSGLYRLRVLKYIPDFIYDMKTHQAASRSLEPKNPALLVSYQEKENGEAGKRWLFARMPDYGQQHGKEKQGPEMVYRLVPAKSPAGHEIVISGASRQVWEIEHGKVVEKKTLASAEGTLPAGEGFHYRFVKSPIKESQPQTVHGSVAAPAAEIELRVGEETHKHRLSAAKPVPIVLPDRTSVLTFQKKPDEVKAYRSQLTVLEDGEEKQSQSVVVNAPLNYGGFAFYQSNYRKDDPTYSGLQVVKDPGLPMVWLGFCMISLGVIFCFYIRPVVLERSKK